MKFDHEKLEVCEISSQSWKTQRQERHNHLPAPARFSAPARKMNRVMMVKSATGTPLLGLEYSGTGERMVQNTYTSGQISSTRAFLYDREDVIAEFSNDTFATVFRRYIHGPGIDEPLAIMGDDVGEYTHYLHDGLGSVTGVVDENGKLGAIDYSAFGETRSNTVKIENRYRYTSREFVETNFYYYRARHMRPDLGRFISMDPLKTVDGTNMFKYSLNYPTLFIDPWGLNFQPFAVPGATPYEPGPNPIATPSPPDQTGSPSSGLGWTGNLWGGDNGQDGRCSLPFNWGRGSDQNSCLSVCCKVHDDCYKKWNCNITSWAFTFLPSATFFLPCSRCNADVTRCFLQAMSSEDCFPPHKTMCAFPPNMDYRNN